MTPQDPLALPWTVADASATAQNAARAAIDALSDARPGSRHRALYRAACCVGEAADFVPADELAVLRAELLRTAALHIPNPSDHARVVDDGIARARGVTR